MPYIPVVLEDSARARSALPILWVLDQPSLWGVEFFGVGMCGASSFVGRFARPITPILGAARMLPLDQGVIDAPKSDCPLLEGVITLLISILNIPASLKNSEMAST